MSEDTTLGRSIRDLLRTQHFIGYLLQEMSIRKTKEIPTAAITYNKKSMSFHILLNEDFFEQCSREERVGVLLHELLHFTNGHLFRFDDMGKPEDQIKKNIVADMAINQHIKSLPKDCVDVKEWKMKDGKPFPLFKTTELYFELLNETTDKPEQGKEAGEDCGKPGGDRSVNYDKMKNYKPFDSHDWDTLTDEEKQQILAEGKKIAERAIQKAYSDHSLIPDSLKSFIMDLDQKLKSLNYKGILKYAIKKHMSSPDRTGTWLRPNKRYGEFAKGTTTDKMPSLNMYIDTSGSISHTEANTFLKTINELMGEANTKKCNIGFWHTSLYNFRKYRKDTPLREADIESGGTDPLCVIEHIKKNDPNLSIILTDGCYSDTPIKVSQKIIWIISENGEINHPYKHIGLTFKLNTLK